MAIARDSPLFARRPLSGRRCAKNNTPPTALFQRTASFHPVSTGIGPFGLLDFHSRAGALQLLFGLVGLLLRNLLQDGLRRAVDEVLGLLEAQARERPDLLDDL